MLKIFGTSWDPDWIRIKKFLGEHNISYKWIDVEVSKASAKEAVEISESKEIPVLVFDDGSHLVEPSNDELKEKLSLSDKDKCSYHDLAVIGGGPSGLAAAVYTTRENIETVVFEKKAFGGQAAITDQIENYPGFPEGINGLKLASDMKAQAEKFGANLQAGIEVTKIEVDETYKKLTVSDGSCHFAKAVLITTGTDYRRLGVPGEEENIGRGVHFCATCDGPFYKGRDLIIIGGGNSAMQEGLFLSRLVNKLTFIVLGDELTGEEILIDKTKKLKNAQIIFNLKTYKLEKSPPAGGGEGPPRARLASERVGGAKRVEAGLEGKMKVYAKDTKSPSAGGKNKVFEAAAVFVFIGLIPNSEIAKNSQVDVDERGFIKTNKTLETNMKGVFAAGDCRSGATLQIASAVGEGATAALMIREYLKEN